MSRRPDKKTHTLSRVIRYLGRDKRAFVSLIVFLVSSTVLSIFAPKIIQLITDNIVNTISAGKGVDFGYVLSMLAVLAMLYAASCFFVYWSNLLIARVSQNAIFDIRQDIQNKLQRLTLNYLDTTPRGDVLARATSDIVTLTNTMETNITQMVTQITVVLGTITMMIITNALLSVIFLLLIPTSIVSIRIITGVTRRLFKRQQEAFGQMGAHIEEMTAAHEVMKAFNYEAEAERQLDELNLNMFKTYLRSRTISGFISPIVKILNNLVYIAVCVFGALSILRGRLTIGGLQAFLMYAQNISSPISQFSVNLNNFQSGLAAAGRIFELLDAEEEPQEAVEDRISREDVAGTVSFKGVNFGYIPGKTLMKSVSFEVSPGQTFAIVGPSGAGKTTLVNLLMRFYDIDGGKITLDGYNIFRLTRKNLRECIGMVLQDTWVFNGTIAENIGYGKPGATRKEIMDAAALAQCDKFIRLLPDGYDTHVSSGESGLSTGERQLLSIARTIIADPKILILDEATSSIDARTEVLITAAMNNMMKGRTSFIIAHRLFTIKNADAIIYMQNGDILEVGTHEQLMEKGGLYSELYASSSD